MYRMMGIITCVGVSSPHSVRADNIINDDVNEQILTILERHGFLKDSLATASKKASQPWCAVALSVESVRTDVLESGLTALGCDMCNCPMWMVTKLILWLVISDPFPPHRQPVACPQPPVGLFLSCASYLSLHVSLIKLIVRDCLCCLLQSNFPPKVLSGLSPRLAWSCRRTSIPPGNPCPFRYIDWTVWLVWLCALLSVRKRVCRFATFLNGLLGLIGCWWSSHRPSLMSNLISSYIFEPVARQARRFSNAPPGPILDADSKHGNTPEADDQDRAPSHVNYGNGQPTTDCSACMANTSQYVNRDNFNQASDSNLFAGSCDHPQSLSSSLPPPPADTIAAGTGPYAITSLGQAFFDRFVPSSLRGGPSSAVDISDSSLCLSRPAEDEHIVSGGNGDDGIDNSSTVDDYASDSEATTRPHSQHQLTTLSGLTSHTAEGQTEAETLSSSLPAGSSTMPTRPSPLRNGYRPFRRSTADARSLSRDLEALERAARTLNRSTRAQPEPPRQIPEDDGRASLRQRIQEIWAMKAPNEEKAKLMHEVMNESYYSLQPQARPTSSDSLFTAKYSSDDDEKDLDGKEPVKRQPVYVPSCPHPPFDPTNPYNIHESDLQISLRPIQPPETPLDQPRADPLDDDEATTAGPDLGCVHYKRNVKIQCFDCKTWWPCRLCHDDANLGHQLPRHRTENMLCMVCSTPSKADQYCDHCQVRSSYYYCEICKLWDDDSTKRIYHCPDCGICRIGEGIGKDYYHCKVSSLTSPIN
jgi:hypothetical protein